MHCTYKGEQFTDGQQVFIKEQPCLSCTCRRAILQCYLRVCPPIVSLEAHKRIHGSDSSSSTSTCQLVKDASQCCPSIRCGDTVSSAQEGLSSPPAISMFPMTTDRSLPAVPSASSRTSSASSEQDVSSSSDYPVITRDRSATGSTDMSESASMDILRTTSNSPTRLTTEKDAQLPKLTVINGFNGQRDSILLITSDPMSQNSIQRTGNLQNSSKLAITTLENNEALLDTILETVYTSATGSKLSGLNLQGSCLLNGSLYMEGSAVMPSQSLFPTSASSDQLACLYCYCIRQRVMCVRPKCHLSISGCTPKYDSEFACCPTSYSCADSYPPASTSGLLSAITNLANQKYNPQSQEQSSANISQPIKQR